MSKKDNMKFYRASAIVPDEALKRIKGGRLKDMTDINPMFRIRKLTEMFGPVGFGWYYEILEERLEECANGEALAFVKINLFYKVDDEWSRPVMGTGGNKLASKERNGLYYSDECFKMALTDALSVACKAIGIGGKVYWQGDKTKYDDPTTTFDIDTKWFYTYATSLNYTDELIKKIISKKCKVESITELTEPQYEWLIKSMKENPIKEDDKNDKGTD